MSKHTPGPWKVQSLGNDDIVIDVDAGRFGIARLYAPTEFDSLRDPKDHALCPAPEMLANARLIAAAPDLLEALRELYHCWDEPAEFVERELDAAMDKAHAALAAATGEGERRKG